MKVLKKLLFIFILMFGFIGFVGCGKDDKTQEEKVLNIGILQLVTHGALDSAREGFIEGLKANGLVDGENIKITVKNPEADNLALQQMATELVRHNDLVLGIATPAAVALQTAADTENVNIPILFTAVTDAVAAQLVESNEAPGGNVTGTSDINPVTDQIDLLKELLPDATKFGIVYNISEVNSEVQANAAKAQATKVGLDCEIKTVSEAVELGSAVTALINSGCQALYLPTDNLVASNIATVLQTCEEHKIPTICGESSMVDAGGTITYGVNYFNLGKQTGEMAVQILVNGVKPSSISVGTQTGDELDIAFSQASLDALGLELPQSIKERIK